MSYIGEGRPRLYAAALTILRAYMLAGRPAHGKPRLGSFEAWDDLVRGAVVWVLGVDPCEGRKRLREEDDEDIELIRALLGAWRTAYPNGASAPVQDAIRRAGHDSALRLALVALDRRGDGTKLDPKAIGYALRRYRGRIVSGLRLERADMVRGGVLWRVVPAGGEPDPRGDGTYGGDVSGQLEIEVGAATTDEPENKNSDDQNHHR